MRLILYIQYVNTHYESIVCPYLIFSLKSEVEAVEAEMK